MAADLELSAKTVETYRSRVLHKLHLRNDVEICQFAIQHGLIDRNAQSHKFRSTKLARYVGKLLTSESEDSRHWKHWN